MRMSCNGCRVLRKGCTENCSIRPCLHWIKNPESQANATVFLAKFYGRAGLMNLINAGPDHLRPAVFRSLLYEACGRILNPIYGSVGLLWSGSWQLCEAAVESVLKGEPITPISSETAANGHAPPLKPYDIRHVSKDETSKPTTRCRVRKAIKPKPVKPSKDEFSHDSSVSHVSELATVDGECKETEEEEESMVSEEETVVVGLELTLGLETVSRANHVVPVKKRRVEGCCYGDDVAACKVELGLECPTKGV